MGVMGSKTPRASTKLGRTAGAMFDDVELHVIKLTYKDLAELSRGDKRAQEIDKATFLQNFPVPGLVGDRLFAALDKTGLGTISFDDFVVGLAVCCRGSLEEKMRFIFGVYDMDGDGLISRDELLLMLNQVPRTLLSIGGGEAMEEFPDAAPIGDVPRTPLRRGRSAKYVRKGNELVPLPAPASATVKRAMSLERPEKRPTVRRAPDEKPVVNPDFTNEAIADQALKDFGDGEAFTFDHFQKWAKHTPAVQALLQGAFPTDSHFSLATSPRARRASCESLADETSVRRSFAASSPTASDAAATAMATVVGWTASRPGNGPPTPGDGQWQQEPVPGHTVDDDSGPSTAGTGVGWGFFVNPTEVPTTVKTPLRAHSRNTSYDNLLRSPLVGQGLITAESPTSRAGTGSATDTKTPRGSFTEEMNNGGGGVTLPGSGSGDGSRPPSSKRRGGGWGSDRASPKDLWRWGEPVESGGKKGSARSNEVEETADGSPQGRPALTIRGIDPVPSRKNDDASLPLMHGRVRRRDPAQFAGVPSSPSRPVRTAGIGVREDGVAPRPRSGGVLRRSTSEVGSNATLPPLGSRNSPRASRELMGKARKLEKMARVQGSEHMSCQDLVALSLGEKGTAVPTHGGVVGKPAVVPSVEGKRRFKPILRHSRSFSHIEGAKSNGGIGMDRRRPSKTTAAKIGRRPERDPNSQSPPTPVADVVRRSGGAWDGHFSNANGNGNGRGTGPGNSPPSLPHGDAATQTKGGGKATPRHLLERSHSKQNMACTPLNMADVMKGMGGGVNRTDPTDPGSARSRHDGSGVAPGSARGGRRQAKPGRGKRDGGGKSSVHAPERLAMVGDNPDTGTKKSNIVSERVGTVRDGPNVLALGKPVSDEGVIPADLLAGYPGNPAVAPTVGAEAVVRDCLYNSHGIVALDGYMWKPGSVRLVKRWFMLVDNTLYYFLRPSDKKPKGVVSLPGCVAEAVEDDDNDTNSEISNGSSAKKEPRKSRVPKGYHGLRLMRPNNYNKENNTRLFLTKSIEERDEWVAELRVASRVVPLEEHFELKALLRKGAFASVHRGIQKETGEEYAIKVIDKTSLSGHEKSLLRGEIGALKLVSHPNVVRLRAVHEDPRSISIVMTLCRGGDLWDKVRAQPSRCFTVKQARMVMRPLCEAVLYLHDLGILHRDIKPENILLVDTSIGDECLNGVILSDFGFSHQVSPQSRLACGKQLMGTPSYMAPESILHGMYGKEVDWFACGCVLYMMLMGRAPFGGADPAEIFRNTCHGRLGLGRGGANHWDRLPAEARDLIVGLMQLDHNLRFTGEQAMRHPWLALPAERELIDDNITVVERVGGGSGHRRQHQSARRGSAHNEKDDGQYNPSFAVGGSSCASTSCASSSSSSGGGGVGVGGGARDETSPPDYCSIIAEGTEILA